MKKAIGLGLILLVLGAVLGAETVRLNLEEAIGLGLQNSTAILAKVNALASARARLTGAQAAYFPSISVSLSWTHLFEQPESEATMVGTPPIEFEMPGSYLAAQDPVALSVDVGQTIATFGKISGSVKLARQAMEQAALDLEEEKRKLIILIRKAFYGYLLALEVQKINRETLESKKESYEAAKERYDAGLISEFEVLNAESDIERFKATVISSDNGVRITLLNAKNALGIEEEGFELELVGTLEKIPVSIDREALTAQAVAWKYDVKSYRQSLKLMEVQDRLVHNARLPNLVAWFNYRLSSGFNSETGKNEYFVWDSWDHNWTTGVNLSVPVSALFPWNKETADIRASKLELANMKIGLDSLISGIKLAVETSILKIAEEEAKIASGRKSVALAQRLYDSARDQYEGGYISSKDLKDSQLGLNGARLALAQAIFSYNMNVIELIDIVGVAGF